MKRLIFTLLICFFLISCGQKVPTDTVLDAGPTDISETTQETNF